MPELLCSFELDGPPLSSNNMYMNTSVGGKSRRILTEEARAWKLERELAIREVINDRAVDFTTYKKKPLRVKYYFMVPKLFQADWDGYIKATQDCVFSAMGLDDRYIVSAEAHKLLEKKRPRIRVEVWSATI